MFSTIVKRWSVFWGVERECSVISQKVFHLQMSELSVFEFVLMATSVRLRRGLGMKQTWVWIPAQATTHCDTLARILISLSLGFLTCKWGSYYLSHGVIMGSIFFKSICVRKKLNKGIKICKHIIKGTIITFHNELVMSWYFQLSLWTALQVSSHINQKYSLKYSVQLDSFYVFTYFFL